MTEAESTINEKMMKLQAISDAIVRARREFDAVPSDATALAVQQLERQFRTLRGTLPVMGCVS